MLCNLRGVHGVQESILMSCGIFFFSKLHCRVDQIYVMPYDGREVTPVGFEPTQLALVELESTPLDHSGKVSVRPHFIFMVYTLSMLCNLRGVHGIQEFMLMSCIFFFELRCRMDQIYVMP